MIFITSSAGLGNRIANILNAIVLSKYVDKSDIYNDLYNINIIGKEDLDNIEIWLSNF